MRKTADDAKTIYADIINLPRHVSKTHPQMPAEERSAIFSPFAALSGYTEMIEQEERNLRNKTAFSDNIRL